MSNRDYCERCLGSKDSPGMVHNRMTAERYLCDERYHGETGWPQGGELKIVYRGGVAVDHDEAARLHAEGIEVRA